MSIRLGYAGFNATLRSEGIFIGRTLRLDTVKKRGLEYLHELALANLDDLKKIILWNEKHGIRFYRMGGDIFPHMENAQIGPELLKDYNLDFARKKLQEIGALARDLGHRLTFHPKQFAQLGSPHNDVVERTILDLNIHANIFLMMGLTPSLGSVMVIHGGGAYGDKLSALDRWRRNFEKLPPTTRQYITIENDEFTFSPQDLLPLCEELDVPLVLDFFHYKCMFPDRYLELFRDSELLDRIARTWTRRGIKQKVHISSQRVDARTGTHDDYIDTKSINIEFILEFCEKYNSDAICECGAKDKCLMRILEKYFAKSHHKNGYFYWTLKSKIKGGYP